MTRQQIKQIASRFDVGSHTYSHVDLTSLSLNKAREEIIQGKLELEDIIGRRVDKFCFPWGKYNKSVANLVKEAGFRSARTARIFCVDGLNDGDEFIENPNLHIYNHKKITYILSSVKHLDFRSLIKALELSDDGFLNVAIGLGLNKIHVWGHSWEVYENGLQKDLVSFLKYFHESN